MYLDECEVFDADAAYIAVLLKSPACTITQLTLAKNWISPLGADALKKAVKYNTRLRVLDLTGNEWMSLPDFDPPGDQILRVIAERLNNNAKGVSNLSAVKRLLQ